MTIGSRIRNRRIELGLTVDEVALKVDKNRATIYRYESEEIENMPISVIEPLAKVLNCSAAYLMGWEDNADNLLQSINETKIKKEQNLLEKYRTLDEYGQDMVDTILGKEYNRCKKPKPTDKEIIAAIEEQDHYQLVAFGGAKEQRIISKEKTLETKKILEEMEKKREEKALPEKRILQEMEENRAKRNKD